MTTIICVKRAKLGRSSRHNHLTVPSGANAATILAVFPEGKGIVNMQKEFGEELVSIGDETFGGKNTMPVATVRPCNTKRAYRSGGTRKYVIAWYAEAARRANAVGSHLSQTPRENHARHPDHLRFYNSELPGSMSAHFCRAKSAVLRVER